MRMKDFLSLLRFALCVVIVLAIMLYIAPKAC